MENHIPNNETRFLFAPYTKINSKWIKDLNIRPETSYIDENTGTKLRDLGLGDVVNLTPKTREVKVKINE